MELKDKLKDKLKDNQRINNKKDKYSYWKKHQNQNRTERESKLV